MSATDKTTKAARAMDDAPAPYGKRFLQIPGQPMIAAFIYSDGEALPVEGREPSDEADDGKTECEDDNEGIHFRETSRLAPVDGIFPKAVDDQDADRFNKGKTEREAEKYAAEGPLFHITLDGS